MKEIQIILFGCLSISISFLLSYFELFLISLRILETGESSSNRRKWFCEVQCKADFCGTVVCLPLFPFLLFGQISFFLFAANFKSENYFRFVTTFRLVGYISPLYKGTDERYFIIAREKRKKQNKKEK